VQPASRSGRYDLAILDFDGVLADSAPWLLRNLSGFLGRHGLPPVSDAELERLRGLPNREIVRQLGVPFWRLPAMARDMRALMADHAGEIPLFAGADAFLAGLSAAKLRVALVSSNAEATVRNILGERHARCVTRFACGASLFGKARIFRRVVHAEGVRQDRVLVIGDETRDMEAARQAGLACAAVTWGYATTAALAACGPDHLAAGFDELAALVIG
jgi:phosphoglycolate phosphatase